VDGLSENVTVSRMVTTSKPDAVRFTAQGQIMIPAWLRRKFGIRGRTRAVVEATLEGILIKPVNQWSISRLRGLLKRDRKPGEPSFAEEWAEHKREEMKIEEDKFGRRVSR
jgi:AbrB family looped-hinge helix DNA binding protein